MGKARPPRTHRYSVQFKATAVRLRTETSGSDPYKINRRQINLPCAFQNGGHERAQPLLGDTVDTVLRYVRVFVADLPRQDRRLDIKQTRRSVRAACRSCRKD
jgi:hypothetical protein